MNTTEIIMTFCTSGILFSLMGLFYKIGTFQSYVEMNFNRIDERFNKNDEMFNKIDSEFRDIKKDIACIKTEISSLDKQISILVVTMRFNGFDFESNKVSGE